MYLKTNAIWEVSGFLSPEHPPVGFILYFNAIWRVSDLRTSLCWILAILFYIYSAFSFVYCIFSAITHAY